MADIFEKLVKDGGPLGQHMKRAHGYFAFPKLEGELGSRMIFRGKERIVWSLNNYLGLANHPETRLADTVVLAGTVPIIAQQIPVVPTVLAKPKIIYYRSVRLAPLCSVPVRATGTTPVYGRATGCRSLPIWCRFGTAYFSTAIR